MEPGTKTSEERIAELLVENSALRETLAGAERERDAARREAESARAETEAANQELQQFVYAASHDLQQPLRTVSTYAQLLEREFPGNAQTDELISFITDASRQMTQLVRDLLTYSRLGKPPSHRKQLQLDSALQWATVKLTDQLRENSAKVRSDGLPEVIADESQMAYVFEQLIGNALKFRREDAPEIDISVEEQDEQFVISVRDNGIGIDPQYRQEVFVPFKRLHGKQIPGSGLGLSLCRKIVSYHGGEIWNEAQDGPGTTFKFSLPY